DSAATSFRISSCDSASAKSMLVPSWVGWPDGTPSPALGTRWTFLLHSERGGRFCCTRSVVDVSAALGAWWTFLLHSERGGRFSGIPAAVITRRSFLFHFHIRPPRLRLGSHCSCPAGRLSVSFPRGYDPGDPGLPRRHLRSRRHRQAGDRRA